MGEVVAGVVFLVVMGAAGVVVYAWGVDLIWCGWREWRAARRSPPKGRRRDRPRR
jgi:hypothetical protein